jgi:serine/threonine protein kinase
MSNTLIGKKIGDYDIHSLLGEGGMARVYKGYDERLDRYAAIKVIEPSQLASDDQEEYGERFLREARAIAKLHHPNVVSVYQFGELDNIYYMAMMFVEGRDLRHILKETHGRGQTLSYDQILRVVGDIASALDYSHQQGVIHRDIKPSNIMVTGDGHSVLTDFGLALSTQEGTLGNTFGSVHYIAPEQAMSSADSVPQSDLYSLGVVLYEMLTGRVPFDDASAMSVALKHISDPPPPASQYNPNLGTAIEDVLNKILDKNPKRRFATGSALVSALEEAFALNDTQKLPNIRKTSLAKMVTNYKQQEHDIIPPLFDSWDHLPSTDRPTDREPIHLTTLDSTSAKRKSQVLPQVSDEPNRRNQWIIALLVLLFVGAGILVYASGILSPSDADVNASETRLIASQASLTAISAIVEEEEPTATVSTNTPAPTVEPTEIATLVTPIIAPTESISTIESPTSAPTHTATALTTGTDEISESQTPEPPVQTPYAINALTADEPEILLYYTSSQFIIYNRGVESHNIDVRQLSFFNNDTATHFTSDQWTFRAARWRMRPQLDCFQLIDGDLFSFDKPDFCPFLQAFERERTPFWRAQNTELTFDVHWDGDKIATCAVVGLDDNETPQQCFIDLPR